MIRRRAPVFAIAALTALLAARSVAQDEQVPEPVDPEGEEAALEGEPEASPDEAEGTEEEEDDGLPHADENGPQRVYIGVYMHHVPELDLTTNSYLADFYLWFRWRGETWDPSQTFELMNLVEGWDVLRAYIYVDDEGNPEAEDLGDGWRYQVLHVAARFGHPFDVHLYPFDEQRIVIDIEDVESVVADMVYVADDGTHAVHPSFAIPGWQLFRVSADVTEEFYPTNFGDTRRQIGEDRYSHFRYSVHVRRPVLGCLATTILPVTIVMLITFVMFLIDSKYFEGRLGLGITSLISAVALQLTFQGDLPASGYLVLLDHVYNVSYLVIFIGLLESVIAVRLHDAGKERLSRLIDRVSLAVVPLIYFGGIALVILLRR